MPDLDYTRALQKDHIHPAASFSQDRLSQCEFLEGKLEALEFFQNRENWNSIVNLHLLDESRNKSKQDRPFADWLKEQEEAALPLRQYTVASAFDSDFTTFTVEATSPEKARLVAAAQHYKCKISELDGDCLRAFANGVLTHRL